MQWSDDNPWESRYLAGETEWDKGLPAPGLVDFLKENPGLLQGAVLYPGCGFGYDAQEWALAGHPTVGLDVAPTAVREATRKAVEKNISGLTFRQGNFLNDEPDQEFDILFEHTLFCAIHPDQRPDYVSAARRWLKPGGHFLAIHYMIPDMDGPPFGVTEKEVEDWFSPYFERIRGPWIPNSYPNRTGLERMYLWKKKD